ncbi:hypothetical protein [Liberiplasma polymorphum]|uniref:hypothetical protein n=1 Tax=Liberiplasma polymorphum TaxID=3374570 RepID=UPI003770A6F9
MDSKNLFYHLARIITISIVHLIIAVYVYTLHISTIYVGLVLVFITMAIMLRYFTLTIQLTLANRVKRKKETDPYLIVNVILGIIVNATIIYGYFLVVFFYITKIMEYFA